MQKHKISLEHAQNKIVVSDTSGVPKTPRQAECARSAHVGTQARVYFSREHR